ncbi:transcriptional regulator family: Fungal Specific TF [Aspergillus niger]|nr:transcriptional regulator family: Fungal Specific TF [Aspergillus niger]KAI2954130.1 transcriptional regulator family: Fungal Specific TF [Aspergillus niger]
MPRRAHKKSRNGCFECKRRHIKCDEKQPICSNCRSSERSCEYADPFIRAASSQSSKSSIPSPAGTVTDELPLRSPAHPSSLSESPPVNMLHAELFFNLTNYTLCGLSEGETGWIGTPDVMRIVVSTPYLINQVLALSALHLSVARPGNREWYRRHAAHLQTHALEIYNQRRLEFDQESSVPLFLFSCILGMHTLCDVLVHREDTSFDRFLERFVHCLKLQLGIRVVISSTTWQSLQESILKKPLQDGAILFNGDTNLGPECARLLRLIEGAKLGDAITSTYRSAVQALQKSMNAAMRGSLKNISGVTGWPVIVSPEYAEHLAMQRPEALVILAHYAVILHWHRHFWLFGDGGRFLIESINRYLGPSWAEWLEWPNRSLSEPSQLGEIS